MCERARQRERQRERGRGRGGEGRGGREGREGKGRGGGGGGGGREGGRVSESRQTDGHELTAELSLALQGAPVADNQRSTYSSIINSLKYDLCHSVNTVVDTRQHSP